MRREQFDALLESVAQAGSIRRGQMTPTRRFDYGPTDIRKIRAGLGLSQSEFALLIGVSVATLQNWEQGRRHPEGPARALLRIAETHPEILLEALGPGSRVAGG